MSYRTKNCGELREENAGEKVTIAGFVKRKRNMGKKVFIDMRDHYGVTQVVADESLMDKVKELNAESTAAITGTVAIRKSKNPDMPTGDIEVIAEDIEIFGKAPANLPFEINEEYGNNKEDLRLQYRYLDLRNREIHDNIKLRAKIMSDMRKYMESDEFLEVQTPIFANSSPEGARDYLVPSRLHHGEFYALPQAPQQFKQLLMISGFDKYYQIAPCFRDEDPRADRSPCEFYQLDFEMSFAHEEDVHRVLENVSRFVFKENTDWKISDEPFRKIPYKEALNDYGIDKPDLRNYITLKNVSDVFEGKDVKLFEDKKVYMALLPKVEGRKFYDNLVDDAKKSEGAEVVTWIKALEGNVNGAGAKLVSEDILNELLKREDYGSEEYINTLKENGVEFKEGEYSIFLVADKELDKAQKTAGIIRIALGNALGFDNIKEYKFCFITDFPFYEKDSDGNIDFSHNPFSKPDCNKEDIGKIDPFEITAFQYDLVCNGYEIASGAERNYDIEFMEKLFGLVGYSKDEVKKRFSALYTAFQYGVPPHAGAALGLDRIVMLLAKTKNIREVIAFPKNKKARDLMVGAPSKVSEEQLKELGLKIQSDKLDNKDLNND